ncbi:MAG TPA: nodulation protein NfeD [Anaeromyxobacter sp.]|nr:nodulation protein NfeD [Anaeromyxobacter sp.]
MRALAHRMVRAGSAAALVLAAIGALARPAPEAAPAGPPRVLSIEINGAITGGTAEYVAAALARAKAENVDALAITMDTPGGMLDATREIVRAILGSEVPVVVWVGPAAAQAASAGTFITLAASVAAMHPTSNIGAAHPVTGSGRDVSEEAGKDMAKKVENDTVAFVRSVAAARGRDADWAEKAVRESVSIVADQAVKLHVVDFVAKTLPEAIALADGRKVKTGAGEKTFRGKGAVLVPIEPTVRQRVLMAIASPNVLALLMLLGTLGIAIEFYHPGAIFPGAAGAFCLLLAFLGMRVIPVNAGAVILILAGVGLLVAEAYVTAHGVAGIGGAACIVIGTLFFIDRTSPEYQFDPGALSLSPWVVWPTPIALAAILGFMAWKIAGARRLPLQLGAPALLGAEGHALTDVGPDGGEAFVHGEYWKARSAAAIPKGARVRVTAVDGLTVTVVDDAEKR